MNMPEDEILQSVRSWLDQHGYVLEMEVARELLPHCSYVVQGLQYIDPVTSKLRETDIYCSWSDPEFRQSSYHTVDMVVECKSTTAPWVAFFGGTMNDPYFPYLIEEQGADCARCEEIGNGLYSLSPGDDAPKAYAITEKRSGKNGADHAREAVLSVASAAISMVLANAQDRKEFRGHYSYRILPVVVTRSPIVCCSLDDKGEVELSLTNTCWVSVVHEKWDSQVMVLAITYKAFNSFVAELVTMHHRLDLG